MGALGLTVTVRGWQHRALEAPTSPTLAEVVRLSSAWPVARGAGVTVAVLDWQFDPRGAAASLYVHDTTLVNGERIGALKPWHGAWMVELVHYVAPEARIMPIIARSRNEDYRAYLPAGIRYAAAHGAAVVTSSMGEIQQTEALRDAIAYAESRGTIFVDVHPELVVGDSGTLVQCRGGECDARIVRAGVVSVPNHPVKPNGARDVYSWPYDLKARFKDGWGFSNAPPVVGGVLALMKSANPNLSSRALRQLVVETAYESNGFRVLDAGAAVQAARAAR
ncbi:MAG: S8 family serine peptidase [Gemmatimonadetes bacterium]|nr:S8 family serine peptidase [Gemmatimonadota bacterium]